jgi:hypothetical protein
VPDIQRRDRAVSNARGASVRELWRAGANVTVSSDGPGYFSTTLTAELGHAARLADLSASDLAELQRRAARAAFAPADVRARLVDATEVWEHGSGEAPRLRPHGPTVPELRVDKAEFRRRFRAQMVMCCSILMRSIDLGCRSGSRSISLPVAAE